MKVLLLHGWPVSERIWVSQVSRAARRGLRRRSHRICTGAGRRSTTGPRSSCATSTARSSPSARRWAATARSRSRAARPSASSGMVLVGIARRCGLVRAPAVPAGADHRAPRGPAPAAGRPDADLEHLAVAQEAMRDRLDLTGVVASFGGPLLVCVGDRDELVSVDGGARSSRRPRSTDGSRCSPDAGHFVAVDQPDAVQRGASRLREPVEDVTLAELRGRLGEDGLVVARRADVARVRRHCRRSLRSAAGPHPRRRQPPARADPRVPERERGARPRRPARGRGDRRVLPRREPVALRRRGARRVPATGRATTSAPGTSGRARCPRTELARSLRGGTRPRARDPVRSTARSPARTRRAAPPAGIGSSSGSSSVHAVTIGSVTSAWNWMPQAGWSSSRNACVQISLRASSVAARRDSNV